MDENLVSSEDVPNNIDIAPNNNKDLSNSNEVGGAMLSGESLLADSQPQTPSVEKESQSTKVSQPIQFTPAPRNLICPEPLSKEVQNENDQRVSGGSFNPILHQSRRDMYGGDRKRGIPKNFQNILYSISNAVIKESNYGKIDPQTKKVFNDTQDIHRFLANYIEHILHQREQQTGQSKGE